MKTQKYLLTLLLLLLYDNSVQKAQEAKIMDKSRPKIKNPKLVKFAERLREVRGNKSQADFSEELGIAITSLSAYENNAKNPSLSVAIDICLLYTSLLCFIIVSLYTISQRMSTL